MIQTTENSVSSYRKNGQKTTLDSEEVKDSSHSTKMSPFTFGSPSSSVNVKTCEPVIGKEPVFGFKLTLKECEPASPLPIETPLPEKPNSALGSNQEQLLAFSNDENLQKLRMLSPRNQTLPPILRPSK
jgi:hypothetical protein